ncbi:MAG TPA: (2Fe-2S) ferredoxin domain-containing protein [Kofleriaceae bacterium]
MASRHLFVCTRARSSGKPACGPTGGDALIAAVAHALLARNARDVLVTACDCLGPCFDGPNAVVYPDGVWYAGLSPADAPGLVDHLVSGRPLATKISDRPGQVDPDSADPDSADPAGTQAGNDRQP